MSDINNNNDKKILGYDSKGEPIYEFMLLWNYLHEWASIRFENGVDPRIYYIVVASDGNPYGVSSHFVENEDVIRKREGIPEAEPIPLVIKPLSDLSDFVVGEWNYPDGSRRVIYYPYDRDELRECVDRYLSQLNVQDKTNQKS